jgi:hypothetical protein
MKDRKMLELMPKEELILLIEALYRIQESNYEELRKQYGISEQNEKRWGAKIFGGKKLMEGFRQGLLSGMVLLNPNLTSTVMTGDSEIDDDNL